ncbi:hypothetical protein Tco_1130609 [Tanacetum coccineum]
MVATVAGRWPAAGIYGRGGGGVMVMTMMVKMVLVVTAGGGGGFGGGGGAWRRVIEEDINKKTENQAKMTKLSMEWKRLCKIKAKVQKCQSQSQYRRISSQTGAGTTELLMQNLNNSDGPGKPNSIYEDCEDQMGPQSITTAHLCAIDKDCEDFEGPILAQLQPISAIVHTKPTS